MKKHNLETLPVGSLGLIPLKSCLSLRQVKSEVETNAFMIIKIFYYTETLVLEKHFLLTVLLKKF